MITRRVFTVRVLLCVTLPPVLIWVTLRETWRCLGIANMWSFWAAGWLAEMRFVALAWAANREKA